MPFTALTTVGFGEEGESQILKVCRFWRKSAKFAKFRRFTPHTQLDRSPSSGGVRSSYLDRFPNHLCFFDFFEENIFSSSQNFGGSAPSLLFTLITQNSENNAKIKKFRAPKTKNLKKNKLFLKIIKIQ